MKRIYMLAGLSLFALLPSPSRAQTNDYSAGQLWGTDPGGVSVNGAYSSAATHANNGLIAGQVNAAKLGTLINGGDALSIQTIGSQNIVSSSINGSNVSVTQSADQTTSNSGDVSNTGDINANH